LIPTAWFVDYWQDYRPQAIRNNEEAMALAKELGDEEFEIEAASAHLRLVNLGQSGDEALRLRQRLEERRDPLRLKEYLFWMMWHHYLRAEFEQCVATCDDGIALAEQLGSPPVQYPSIKGLALVDLGRFDEAWASLQEEVADDDHPFGRCMRELGVAVWLGNIRALERAETKAKEVLEEAGRLSRTWMQRFMMDLLALVAAWRGEAGKELGAWVENKGTEIGFQPTELVQAELALARGDNEIALTIADQIAEYGAHSGVRRARIMALEIALRALERLERWDDLQDRANAAVAEAEGTGFRTRLWRMLATRARGRATNGDAGSAAQDRAAARALVDDMASRIEDPELRALFDADPAVVEVRSG
jgi:hypothetical protein